jgi:futalosine hydrolase
VPTAYALGRRLAQKQYDFALNAGIAGAFRDKYPPGTVVNVVEDCVAELGAEDGDKLLSVFELGLADPDDPPFQGGRLFNTLAVNDTLIGGLLSGLPKVRGITSNTVHGNTDSIARIKRIADADIESMEGAAFFHACLSAALPCLQIRAISNMIEERDRSRWRLDLALENLNRTLLEILHRQASNE